MKNSKEHIKVLTALSLAASDTREDTLISILINTLFQKCKLTEPEILKSIEELYGFEPYAEEVHEIILKLLKENRILKEIKDFYILSESEIKLNQALDLQLKDKEKARFQNFKNFITDSLGAQIEISQIRIIWGVFVEYLYNNFYEFGEEALKKLHPHLNAGPEIKSDDDFFQMAYSSLKDKGLCLIFKQTVEMFPDYASADDIDFLNDLAQKTLSFTSLGMDPKLADSTIERSLIEWVLYLDTNVIYSLLNLHSHPENAACKALILLIKENKTQIKIALRYSELTKKELNAKSDDFNLLDENLSESSIRALLRSNNLDDFSRQFYENLLNNKQGTLHPSKIIELAPKTLLQQEIDIARNQKRVEKIGEEYLNTRIQDYRRFIDEKNQYRQDFNEEKKANFRSIQKSDKQIIHDITLREIILDQRSSVMKPGKIATLNSVKYFGITLDELLLAYDRKEIKDFDDPSSFPIFFRPSFLLNKLVRILPIKTLDYKKAFIKAVTSKGFNKDVQKSHDILKIVNYLKSQGIDNEDVVYNIISEELFLEKYRKNKNSPDFNHATFIESELNREFSEREKELKRTKIELSLKIDEAKEKSEKKEELEVKKVVLENELDLYKKALITLQSTVAKLEKRSFQPTNQTTFDFEAESQKVEVEKLKKKYKKQIEGEISIYKNSKLKSWQRKLWWNLFWVIPLTVVSLTIILIPSIVSSLTIDSVSIRVILGVLLFLFDGIFLLLLRMRYWDEGNKQKRLENTIIPIDLQQKLNELYEN